MTADGPKLGFLGNINKDQEARLQDLWSILLKAVEISLSNEPIDGFVEEPFSPTQSQRRLSLLSRTQSKVSEKPTPTPNTPYHQNSMTYLGEIGAGMAESHAIKKALSEISPTELRTGVLDTLKHDHPDAVLLRFLRARKWDVPKSFAMMVEAVVWRLKEMHVDEDVMAKGELHALKQTQSESSMSERKAGNDFLSQIRMGKSYVHGVDRAGRPIVVVRVRLHKPGAQSEESLERHIIHLMESVRLTMAAPIETAAVLFDMTGFSLSNMGYPVWPVLLLLGSLATHHFNILGIWRLIRGLMDPEIAAKVEFTNSVAELEKFIPRDQIAEEMGGDEKWSYKYIEPNSTENSRMDNTTIRDALKRERQAICEEFLAATSGWIEATKSKDVMNLYSSESERAYLAERLRVNYWKLDPYSRARLLLDRTNIIQDGGKIEFYPKKAPMESDVRTTKALDMKHLERVEDVVLAMLS
ncbi:hypothetical protein PEX1_027180 [Penicillium expansum]|uniref:CRAL-TRIO domain-containing protein n=1 Tax=Penicillium expansum TaxID=27334 RepID=A0A0A2K940_PENEN|nr:hypothetical protein PEX2_011800 [Penicillium expansum]KGO40693.1 hypothetical protein PEXP_071920 [Penicillium expansum]KGO63391.1 hypothetical protein PEX2_011800 [Penicillium expansum]KGO70788.1 hypothetical protein PEX1_027180 [Penicillium expansum]